jgi:hypothetical protein
VLKLDPHFTDSELDNQLRNQASYNDDFAEDEFHEDATFRAVPENQFSTYAENAMPVLNDAGKKSLKKVLERG